MSKPSSNLRLALVRLPDRAVSALVEASVAMGVELEVFERLLDIEESSHFDLVVLGRTECGEDLPPTLRRLKTLHWPAVVFGEDPSPEQRSEWAQGGVVIDDLGSNELEPAHLARQLRRWLAFASERREVRSLQQRIEETECRFQRLADSVPTMIWLTDERGSMQWANRAWIEFSGLGLTAIIGRAWNEGVHPDDQVLKDDVAACALTTRNGFVSEARRRNRDGAWRWVLERGAPLYDAAREFQGFLVSAVDVSERRHMVDVLQSATLAAEMANRAKSEFLANMSHEIRTPLTAIIGFSEELRAEVLDSNLSPDGMSAVGTIERNGRHLLNLINDVLDLSKIEAGEFGVESIRASLAEIIRDVVFLLRPRAIERGLDFRVNSEALLPSTFVTDPTRLKQILVNLVGNAIKFTHSGHVALRLSMVEDHPIGRLRIDVEDTGIGLDPAAVEKIFQPFSQADMTTTRRFGGTGLGLTISRQLAAMMEGTLDLHRAAPGEGAVFRVELPIHGPEGDFELLDADQSLAPVLPSTDVEPHFEGRVLLAEDNPVNRLLVTKILERLGLEVEAAVNGELAYHTAIDAKREGRPFDIILMDMQMPKMDGFEATRKLREAGYQGPIVALTAAAMSGDQTRCLEAGCDDYTTKPIDRRRLHGILTALIGTREGASPAPADRAPRFPCATA